MEMIREKTAGSSTKPPTSGHPPRSLKWLPNHPFGGHLFSASFSIKIISPQFPGGARARQWRSIEDQTQVCYIYIHLGRDPQFFYEIYCYTWSLEGAAVPLSSQYCLPTATEKNMTNNEFSLFRKRSCCFICLRIWIERCGQCNGFVSSKKEHKTNYCLL